jgi:large subunit ribosomal protein L29
MKSSRRKEIRAREDKELAFDLKNAKKELFNLRFHAASEKVAKPSEIRRMRREIALINTLMRERELGIRGEKHR